MTSLVSGGVGCGVASYEDDLSVSCPFGLMQRKGKLLDVKGLVWLWLQNL